MHKRAISLLLLLGALFGVLAQAHARTRIPQPLAMAEKLAAGESGARDGMELPSDLFGEAALSEDAERASHELGVLELIALKGWSIAFVMVDPPTLLVSPAGMPPVPTPAPSTQLETQSISPTLRPPRAAV